MEVPPEVAIDVRSVQPAGGVTVAVASRSGSGAPIRLPGATPGGFVIESGDPVFVLPVPPGEPTIAIGSITYGTGSEPSSIRSARKRDEPRRSSDQRVPAGVTSVPAAS